MKPFAPSNKLLDQVQSLETHLNSVRQGYGRSHFMHDMMRYHLDQIINECNRIIEEESKSTNSDK